MLTVAERKSVERATSVPAIALRGLAKHYGRHEALHPIDLDIGDGEFFCLLGPSGSGKTTTLNLIGGFLAPSAGTIEIRGRRVQVAGVSPRTFWQGRARPDELADPRADLRILLCHYPRVVDRVAPGRFQLVLAGHLHAGQISLPCGAGRLRLAHLKGPYHQGLYRTPRGVLHLSPGLGTTFVPFRFFARPEATELVLQPSE
jgi:energy-coupling factor transporter ATP-binding protein EcfA2